MVKIPIEVVAEPVDDCRECDAACCRAHEIMSLTIEEASFMLRGGNKLFTIAQPVPYERNDVIYPRGFEINDETGETKILLEDGNEYEPLAANMGRYVLMNDCKYLVTDPHGWTHCGVYAERPGVCRDFEEGGEKCHLLQRWQSHRALTEG